MAPELDTVTQLALEAGYLAAYFADMQDTDPRVNETACTD